MAAVRSIAKNTGLLIAASLIQKALTLILVALVVRMLGAEGLGLYSFIFSFAAIFGVLAHFGIDILGLRDISHDKTQTRRILGEMIATKTILSFGMLLVLFVSAKIMGYDDTTIMLILLAGIATAMDNMAGTFRSAFLAYEKMEFDFLVNTVSKIILFGISFFSILNGFGVFGLAVAAIAAAIANIVLSVLLCTTKIAKPEIVVDFSAWKRMIIKAWPFCSMGLFSIVYAKINIIMLSSMQGNAAVGFYDSAMRLAESLSLVITSFLMAIFPVMSRFFAQKNDVHLLLEKSVKFVVFMILPVAFGTTLLAPQILAFFYKPEFLSSAPSDFLSPQSVLMVLVWYSVLSFVLGIFQVQFNSMHKEKLVSKILALTVGIQIVLSLFLIPQYSFVGAAVATLISQAVFFVIAYYFIKKQFGGINFVPAVSKPLIAAIAMAAAIVILPVRTIFIVPIAAAVYFAVFLGIGGFAEDDIRIIKKALQKH